MTEMGDTGEQVPTADPGSSSRGLGAIAAVLGLVAALTVGAIALDSGTPAAAAGLEQFASCADLQAYTDDLQESVPMGEQVLLDDAARVSDGLEAGASSGGDTEESAAVAAASPTQEAPTTVASSTESDDSGGTNTVVEGVDEIDIIDRVAPDRLLVSRQGALALVDLDGLTVVAELRGVPFDARVSAVDGIVFVAGGSVDGLGTEVRRVRIDGDSFVEEGTWSTTGYLVDARRTGDRLHVVAVDQPYEAGVMPFEDGPVPCDQVWRPVAPATTPAATLVATLPATGELVPTAAAEVTGSGGTILVTDSAVYVATSSFDDVGAGTTGLHRFDLATLAPTGSGSVPGIVSGPFALNEHEGNLRVASTATGGVAIGRPIPIEGDAGFGGEPAVDVAVEEEPPVTVEPSPDSTVVDTDTSVPTTFPETTVPETTVPETTVPETTVPETTVPETTVPETTVPETTVVDESALAEVFVLDTEGDLDVIGRTGRFGREFETIHGVRFVGDLAYVVTFLETDPFWVIDLSDPTAPTVVGELQVPGFSGYLHPVGDGLVVGFGPDGAASIAARLFDVSDPSAPRIVDQLRLGDDSPVVWDHHAFVELDESIFAVPFTDYPDFVGGGCEGSTGAAGVDDIAVGEPVPDIDQQCTAPTPVGGATGALVLAVEGGQLVLLDQAATERSDVYAERVVQRPGGTWLVLSYDRLVDTSDGAELVLPIA